MRTMLIAGMLVVALLLAACSQKDGLATTVVADQSTASEPLSGADEDTSETGLSADEEALAEQATATVPTAPTLVVVLTATPVDSDDPAAEPTEPVAPEGPIVERDPFEVTYFTPAQTEGPYYPVDRLDDHDNDLTVVAGADGTPAGQIVEFGGIVYDASGIPQSGVLIEIWQTDASGVYLHPGDPGTDQRDRNFQFYGESLTDDDGRYQFRTVLPGRYEPRPRHIHVKVKLDGQEVLTTQFYFADDPELAGESIYNQVGPQGEHLIITLEEAQDGDGNSILLGQRDIILNMTM